MYAPARAASADRAPWCARFAARGLAARRLASTRGSAPGFASAPRVSRRFRAERARLRAARPPHRGVVVSSSSSSFSSASSSSSRGLSSPARPDGAGLAIVGLGSRGGVVVDRFISGRVFSRARFWALNADTVSLAAALAPNRWRLPPSTVDPASQAVKDNAEAVASHVLAGGLHANAVPPEAIVVFASAAEAAGGGAATLEALARLKDGQERRRGWFNVGGTPGVIHEGPLVIVAALLPFTFEGPRKSAAAKAFLEKADRCADVVVAIPQEALTATTLKAGEAPTVQEATAFADVTLQWSAWSALEMLRSPTWIGTAARGDEGRDGRDVLAKVKNRRRTTEGNNDARPASSDAAEDPANPEAWAPALSPEALRRVLRTRAVGFERGCGVCGVGHASATTRSELRGAQAEAVAEAVAAAFDESPFFRRERDDDDAAAAAELVMCVVRCDGELTSAARRAAVDALGRVVAAGPGAGRDPPPMLVSAAPSDPARSGGGPGPDPRAVEATLLVATSPAAAYAPADAIARAAEKARRTPTLGGGLAFPIVPGMAAGPMAKAAKAAAEKAEAARRARRDGGSRGPARAPTNDMLRKLGLAAGDEGTAKASDDEGTAPASDDEGTAQASGDEGTAQASGDGGTSDASGLLPPLPTPRRVDRGRLTLVGGETSRAPMPNPDDPAFAVAPPEARATPGKKLSAKAPRVLRVDDRSPEADAEAEKTSLAVAAADAALAEAAAHVAAFDEARVAENKPEVRATERPGPSNDLRTDDPEARRAAAGLPVVVVPLPEDIDRPRPAFRVLARVENDDGTVSWERALDASDDASDASVAARREASEGGGSSGLKARVRLALDADRGARETVRMEFAGGDAYEGEWFDGEREGEGRQTFANGDEYVGRWRGGAPDGRGVIRFALGGEYEGMWRRGKPNGPGVLDLEARGGGRHDGAWVDGELRQTF